MEVRPEVGGRNSPHAAATSTRLLGPGHRWRPPTVKPTYFGVTTLALFLFAFLALISNNIAQAQTSTNTPPVFTNAAVDRSVPENSLPGRGIGEPVAATDADNDALTYRISGAEASVFGIDRLSGQIMVGRWTALDYETRSSYTITVTATDTSGATATISVNITVTDVNLGTAYDFDDNEEIDLAEVLAAIRDYLFNGIEVQMVLEVIRLYLFQAPPTPTPTPTPPPTPKRTCIPQPPQQLTMEQVQAINALSWAQDRPEVLEDLRRLAMRSPAGFKAFLQRFGESETGSLLLSSYVSISLCAEEVAIHLLQMPFLSGNDRNHFDTSAIAAVKSLSRLAKFDQDGMQKVLSYPEFRDGITDAQTALVALLVLEQEDLEAGSAIAALPWVQDGISYTPYSDVGLVRRDLANYELTSVVDLVEMAPRSSELFWALLDKPWVRDGYTLSENEVIISLIDIATRDDKSAAQILEMPFLQTVYQRESLHIMVQILQDLARNSRSGLRRLLSSPALSGGITSDQLATVALLDLEVRNPDAAAAVQALPWIQDGIDPSEQDAVLALRNIELESDLIFWALLPKQWMQDSMTPDKTMVIYHLVAMAGESYTRANEPATLRILDMPFLETIDPIDPPALSSLSRIISEDDMWDSAGSILEQILAHTSLRDGITEDQTNIVAVLALVRKNRPDLLDVLLNPEQTVVKERSITLPLTGELALSVIWPETTESDERASRTVDLLEHALSTQEEFMTVSYPKNYAIALIADITQSGGGGGPSSIITLDPPLYEDYGIIAHEAAHTYWYFYPRWIAEGAASFMADISEKARTGAPLPEPVDSCSSIDNIAELEKASDRISEDIYCNYTLGEGIFLNLYRSLGDGPFRRGFANLYLLMRDETLRDKCTGTGRSVCYIKAAFLTGATPENASIAEAVINRRYYGASP